MSFMWKRDLKNLKDRRKETGGGWKAAELTVYNCLKLRKWSSTLEIKAPLPPLVQAAQDLHWAAQIPLVNCPSLKTHLHPSRGCWPAGVHSLDVTGLAPPHHKAPAHRVADDLEREKKDVIAFGQLGEIQGGNIYMVQDIISTSLYFQHHSKGCCVQAAISLMGKTLSKWYLLLLMNVKMLN